MDPKSKALMADYYAQRRERLERIVDLDNLLEDDNFLDAFCDGCPAIPIIPRSRFDECPAGDEPGGERCLRRREWESILEILEGARYDIATIMADAGCEG